MLIVGLAALMTIVAASVTAIVGPGRARAAIGAVGRAAMVGRASSDGRAITAVARQGGSCDQVSGAYQMPGADGVVPGAWTGDGLTVPACGPIPNDGGSHSPVYPYPGALWTPGYQCVEFSERYLFYRYGVTMGIPTDGDQVAAHYAAAYPALFAIVKNGTPDRAPVAGDVLSMATVPGFNEAGGHTAVVQSSSVDADGNGSVTIVEENAVPSGIQVLRVSDWSVHYDGFPYMEWLTTTGPVVTTPALPSAQLSQPYSQTLTATGGGGPWRWALTSGSLPPGLSLSRTGVLSGTVSAATASGGDMVGTYPFTVTATDAKGAVATDDLQLSVAGSPETFYHDASTGSLRDARWTGTRWVYTTVDGAGSTLAGHTTGTVGSASSAVEVDGQPMVFYSDATTGSLRAARRSANGGWQLATLDGPGSTLPGHTDGHVGSAVSAVVIGGEPAVFYYDASDTSLRYARETASGWQFETLDGPGSALYQHTWHHVGSALSALAIDGAPQVYYYDASAGALHRAWWNGSRWFFLTIDGPTSKLAGHVGGLIGPTLSATVLSAQPTVFYDDTSDASLRYAQLTGSGWQFRTLDGSGSTLAGHTSDHVGSAVAVTQMKGYAQVYYYDATRQSLRHAFWTGSGWVFETLDGAGSVISGHDSDQVGAAVSVTEMPNGPQVFYADASAGSLRHAWWTSSGWQFETLDGPGSVIAQHTGDRVGGGVSVTLS